MKHYDAIVLGLGGMGSAALSHLARRGLRVLGLEQYPLVHDRGSSHGQTRIIRTAYAEHPSYVPLVRRSFELWRELEARTGKHLLTMNPCMNAGPADGAVVRGVQTSAKEHNLAIETLSPEEVRYRYPAFHLPEGMVGVVEQAAGVLMVEDCVRAHLDDALATGRAEVRAEEAVLNWRTAGSGVEVTTAKGTYSAARLIVTAGAWATKLLQNLGVPLRVVRQVPQWFAGKKEHFELGKFPSFIVETPEGEFYGLPSVDGRGMKCAQHCFTPALASPEEVNWSPTDADEIPVRKFLKQYLPEVGKRTEAQVCMYTITPDRHFVIDVHPESPAMVVAAGFSGHGFKFSAVVGEILADLAMHGRTDHAIKLFSAMRFH